MALCTLCSDIGYVDNNACLPINWKCSLNYLYALWTGDKDLPCLLINNELMSLK